MSSTISKINILFIENNLSAIRLIDDFFAKYGIEITNFRNYEVALKKIDLNKHFDIIIANTLDSSNGWVNFIKLIKAYSNSNAYCVVLGNGDIQDLLYATEIEAIKYFTIPCDYEKVASYVLSLAQDINSSLQNSKNVFLQEGWQYSFENKVLIKNEDRISLTKNEIAFLEALINNKNKIVTYDELKFYIYKTRNLKSDKLHAIRTLARNIRAKTNSKELIHTLNRIGYKIKIND